MANPSPQHTPTDGLGTAAYVVLSCDAPSALTKVGSSVALSPGNRVGGNQYALTLSVAGTGAPIYQSVNINPLVVDAKGTTFSSGNGNKAKGRVYPAGNIGQGTEIVYVVNQGGPLNLITLTANKVGQAIVEVYFPTFDNTDGIDFIYAQIIVTVVA